MKEKFVLLNRKSYRTTLDLRLDDYLIWSLDHFISIQGEWGVKTIPLSAPTAEILDAAAIELIVDDLIPLDEIYSTFLETKKTRKQLISCSLVFSLIYSI